MLGNSLIRAVLRGDTHGVAVTVVSLVNQTGHDNTAAAASTITALTTTAADSLVARLGKDGALAYLAESDSAAQLDAVVNGKP